jgi:hypothetical protein
MDSLNLLRGANLVEIFPNGDEFTDDLANEVAGKAEELIEPILRAAAKFKQTGRRRFFIAHRDGQPLGQWLIVESFPQFGRGWHLAVHAHFALADEPTKDDGLCQSCWFVYLFQTKWPLKRRTLVPMLCQLKKSIICVYANIFLPLDLYIASELRLAGASPMVNNFQKLTEELQEELFVYGEGVAIH